MQSLPSTWAPRVRSEPSPKEIMSEMILVSLPPSPAPRSVTAKAFSRSLGEHSKAFWNFHNPNGAAIHLTFEQEPDDVEVRSATLCEIECLKRLEEHWVVKVLNGNFQGQIARLPATSMAWDDRKALRVGDHVFAVALPIDAVKRKFDSDFDLVVSRNHSKFISLLLERFTGQVHRSVMSPPLHTGAIFIGRGISIREMVGKDGVDIKALARLAGIERVVVCHSVDFQQEKKQRVWQAMLELYGENRREIGLRVGMYKGRTVAIVRADERHRKWLFGKEGVTLNLLSVLSNTAIVALPPGVKLKGFMRFTDLHRLGPEAKRLPPTGAEQNPHGVVGH